MADLALGVDIGGTGVKVALIKKSGRIQRMIKFPTPKGDPIGVVDLLAQQARSLLESVTPKRIRGIGVGMAGDIDQTGGMVRISPNLGWRNVPIRDLLSSRFPKIRISLDNDANAAAWAAYSVEAKKTVQTLVCVTLGTGVGSGIVLNGRLYRGATGSAGELGHMTLYPEGIECPCGNKGCVERYVSSRAIVELAKKAVETEPSSKLARLVHKEGTDLTSIVLERAARQGDSLARHLWDQAGERLGIALASVINLLNPDWIVLAGGLSRAGSLLLTPLRRTIQERTFQAASEKVKIHISRLDQDLGVVGAGLFVWS